MRGGLQGGGSVSLRGSLDYERLFNGAQTSVQVSGEQLVTKSMKNTILLGLGSVYRQGSFSFGLNLSGGAMFGSGDAEFSGSLDVIMGF